jgi:hypothetical protein
LKPSVRLRWTRWAKWEEKKTAGPTGVGQTPKMQTNLSVIVVRRAELAHRTGDNDRRDVPLRRRLAPLRSIDVDVHGSNDSSADDDFTTSLQRQKQISKAGDPLVTGKLVPAAAATAGGRSLGFGGERRLPIRKD